MRMAGAPTEIEGGGQDEREEACKSGLLNADIAQNVQSSGIQLG